MTSKDREPRDSYEPPVAEDVEASEGPVATAPASDGGTGDTPTDVEN